MVLCCQFLMSEIRWGFTLCLFMLCLVRFGLLSGHLFETEGAAYSVDHMFSLYFDYLLILFFHILVLRSGLLQFQFLVFAYFLRSHKLNLKIGRETDYE